MKFKLQFIVPRAFTLIELLVVMAVIGIVCALLLPTVSRAKRTARRSTCLNNLKQVNLGLQMFADENGDVLPNTNAAMSAYKEMVKTYVGLEAPSSPNDRVFSCPADQFTVDTGNNTMARGSVHESPEWDYSSYGFNGLNHMSDALPGVAGKKLTSIQDPVRTVLLAEVSAFTGFSWHDPNHPPVSNNARSMVSFADGHVNYIPIYWDGYLGKTDSPMCYDPPEGYNYRWSP